MTNAKIISVSFSEGDQAFVTEKNLSPSRLLQERITQIRDDADPQLREALASQQKHNENLSRKMEFVSSRFQKIWDKHTEGMSDEESDKLQEELF